MKYLYFLIILIISNTVFGQAEKIYINKSGAYSGSPDNAASYILMEKINDTAYSVKQYTMQDTILYEGTYKDAMLTIQNGIFKYYQKIQFSKNTINNLKIDTNNFVHAIGRFINGKKSGLWIEYEPNGKKLSECTYKDNILNGQFKYYNDDYASPYWTKGYVINNQLEGKYYIFSEDSVLIYETNFLHSKQVKITNDSKVVGIMHLQRAKPDYNLRRYLEKQLITYKKQLKGKIPIVKITSKSGKISSVKMVIGINQEVDSAIIKAISVAPDFIPAKYDELPIDFSFNLLLPLFEGSSLDFNDFTKQPYITELINVTDEVTIPINQ